MITTSTNITTIVKLISLKTMMKIYSNAVIKNRIHIINKI